MKILFLFLDGVGLGDDNPETNPFAVANLPTLQSFTEEQQWFGDLSYIESERAIFLPVDANLGVDGKPQSATGQATIMTGVNVPHKIGYHYGPKPNPEVAEVIQGESVVTKLADSGLSAALLNAYPDRFIEAIDRGKRLRSSNQLAFEVAGVGMRGSEDFVYGRALSADFTGRGWIEELAESDAFSVTWRSKLKKLPVLTPREAGHKVVELTNEVEFAFFDYWLTDYMGHRGTMDDACGILENLDGVLAGILEAWDDEEGLIIMTSDHGNIEDISERGHTRNKVPTLIVGKERQTFADGLVDLTGFTPALLRYFENN